MYNLLILKPIDKSVAQERVHALSALQMNLYQNTAIIESSEGKLPLNNSLYIEVGGQVFQLCLEKNVYPAEVTLQSNLSNKKATQSNNACPLNLQQKPAKILPFLAQTQETIHHANPESHHCAEIHQYLDVSHERIFEHLIMRKR